jgi:hypothetical protein
MDPASLAESLQFAGQIAGGSPHRVFLRSGDAVDLKRPSGASVATRFPFHVIRETGNPLFPRRSRSTIFWSREM